jgi:hypothetical protein
LGNDKKLKIPTKIKMRLSNSVGNTRHSIFYLALKRSISKLEKNRQEKRKDIKEIDGYLSKEIQFSYIIVERAKCPVTLVDGV